MIVNMADGTIASQEQKDASRSFFAFYMYYETDDEDLARAICSDIKHRAIRMKQRELEKAYAELTKLNAQETTAPVVSTPVEAVPCEISKKCKRWFAK